MRILALVLAALIPTIETSLAQEAERIQRFRDFRIGMTRADALATLSRVCEKMLVDKRSGNGRAQNCYQSRIRYMTVQFKNGSTIAIQAYIKNRKIREELKKRLTRRYGRPFIEKTSRIHPNQWFADFSVVVIDNTTTMLNNYLRYFIVSPNHAAVARARAKYAKMTARKDALRAQQNERRAALKRQYQGRAVQGLRDFKLWFDKSQHLAIARRHCRSVNPGDKYGLSGPEFQDCYGYSYKSVRIAFKPTKHSRPLTLYIVATVPKRLEASLDKIVRERYGSPKFNKDISRRFWYADFQISLHRRPYGGLVLTIYSLASEVPASMRKRFGVRPQKLKL